MNPSNRRSSGRELNRAAYAASLLVSAYLSLACSQAPAAAGQAGSLPPLKPAQPLRLPGIVRKELPNGLKLVIIEDHRQPALWLRLAIGAGSIRDPKDRVGLAHMTADMLDKGTASRSEAQIADKIDGLGASLGASADVDYLTVSASGLSAYTDDLFDLLSDISLHPTFPKEELERTRTQTLSGIVASLGRPATVADAALRRRVYGAHPYGNFAVGTTPTVKAITQQDLVSFRNQNFVANNATLFIVGDITAEQATARAMARFGDWKRGDVPPMPTPPSSAAVSGGAQITIIDRPGAAQTEVRVGLLTTGYSDPNRPISRVASAVLGLGQFEGRLTKEIRVKRGLTYGAASFFDRKGQAGMFTITTFTKNASTGEVVKIALEEARRLQQEPTPAEELQERKEFLSGSFAVSVATTPGVLQRLVPAVLYGAGPEELTRYTTDLQAVSAGQIEEYMRTLPLDRPQIVLVGDASAIESQVKPFGTVTVIPSGSLDLQSLTLQGAEPKPSDGGAQTGTPAEGKSRLAASVAALGGDAFLNLKQMSLKGAGEMSPPGQNMSLPIASATLIFAPPGRSRFELNTMFGDVIFGNDGTGKPWLSALGALQDAPSGFGDPTDLLRMAVQKGYEVISAEDMKDPSGAGMLQGLTIKDADSHSTRIYLDGATHLPRLVTAKSNQGTFEVYLNDYHTTEGISLPGTLKVMLDGKSLVSLKFTAWSVNKPVDEKLFVRPKS
jgi:zinc protease